MVGRKNENKKEIILWLVIALSALGFLSYFISTAFLTNPTYSVKDAVFDMSDIDFDKTQLVEVRGDAEFYIDSLLGSVDFSGNVPPIPDAYATIPSKWNALRDSLGDDTPGHGYATYRFRIVVADHDYLYGVKIKDFKLAYNLYVNGEYLGSSGKVGRSAPEMIPSRFQKEFLFTSKSDTLDFILQISNFHHRKGGTTGSMIFGKAEDISNWKKVQSGIDSFIIGLLFILFIYHLILYVYRSRDFSILYFSLLCLTMMLRTGFIGERIFLEMFYYIGWNVATKIEYLSFMGIPIFTVLFINNLVPNEIKKWVVWFVNICAILCMVIVLFFKSTIYSYTPIFIQYIIGPASVYMTIMLFVATIRKRKYAFHLFIGFFFFFILSVHDAVSYATLIDSANFMPLGLFIVTFSQAYVLALKNLLAYNDAERLADELKVYSSNLEELVQERMLKIEQQKNEIEQQKHSIEMKAEELRTTNENLIELAEYKKNMTSMMVHDLKNPISNIIGFTSLQGSIDEFKDHIHASGWNMLNLIQNILDLEKHETSKMKLRKNELNLNSVISEAQESTRYLIDNRNLNFTNKVNEGTLLKADKEILVRILANIFSNAAKYAMQDGNVEISCSDFKTNSGKQFTRINIYNDGEAIPDHQLDLIFNKYTQSSYTNEKIYHSSGIGLAFCKMAVHAHGGEIGVISEKESGVTFWFTIPS